MVGPDLLSVAELLRARELREAVLLTGGPRSLERRVHGVSVQEAAVEDFVRPDELVMTTALGLDSPSQLAKFVSDVGASGASALAISRRPGAPAVSGVALAAARERDLPLLELPWKLPFSVVMSLVLGRVHEAQTLGLLAAAEAKDVFDQLTGHAESVHALADFLEGTLARRVQLIDPWGVRLHSRAVPAAPGGEEWTCIPIVAGSRRLATLRIGGRAPFSTVQAELLRRGAAAFARLLLAELADARADAQARTEFVGSLVDGLVTEADELRAQATAVGLDLAGLWVAVSLRCEVAVADQAALPEAAEWAAARALTGRKIQGLQAWRGGVGMLVLPVRSAATTRSLVSPLANEVAASLRSRFRNVDIRCGVGRAVRIGDLLSSLREARTASRIATRPLDPAVILYDDIDVAAILKDVMRGAPEALEALQDRCLTALLAYQHDRGLPLTETLLALFGENGNVSSTARRLSINRQSLLYRLDKAQELCGLSLARSTDRLALELAVGAWQVAESREASPTTPA